MQFISILMEDEEQVFTKYCVYYKPVYSVSPCDATDFTNSSLAAILNVTLELNKTGWMHYEAQANTKLLPKVQMKAIGYGEGYLFSEHIANHFQNIKDWFLFAYLGEADDYPEEVFQFYDDNLRWTREQSQMNKDAYWRQVAYTMSHFDGLYLGYSQTAPADYQLSELELFIYMSSGDLLDVVEFACPETRKLFNSDAYRELADHCSGLVRIYNDELYLSQTAWFTYGSMTRVAKSYSFKLDDAAATNVRFSSYPGFSYSFDDWYQTNSGFMYLETTDNVNDATLYEFCSEESLMTWIRAPIAGRLATSAQSFVQIISKYNSGTYNNQWVVADLKAFEAQATENVVYVMEQIPGISASYDATARTLQNGYFPSYNTPSMEELYIASGYIPVAAKNSSSSYTDSARAKIFARDAPNIIDFTSMKAMMRYNNYMNDELASETYPQPDGSVYEYQEPSDAISSRYDLRIETNKTTSVRKCFGGFDTKVGMYNRNTKEFQADFISSPAYDDVEAWSFPDPAVDDLYCPRKGLPDGPYHHDFVNFQLEKNWE